MLRRMEVAQYVPPTGCREIRLTLSLADQRQVQALQQNQLNELHRIMEKIKEVQRYSREFFPTSIREGFQSLLRKHGDINQMIKKIMVMPHYRVTGLIRERDNWQRQCNQLDDQLSCIEREIMAQMWREVRYCQSLYRIDQQTLRQYQDLHRHLQAKYGLEKKDPLQQWHQETIMIQQTGEQLMNSRPTPTENWISWIRAHLGEWGKLLDRGQTQIEEHVRLMTHYRQAERDRQKPKEVAPTPAEIPAEVMAIQMQEWGGEMTEWGFIGGIEDLRA